jgi:hypothetical protein
VAVDPPAAVSDCDDLAIQSYHGIGVEVTLHALVGLIADHSPQLLTSTMVEIDYSATSVIVFLPAVIQQALDDQSGDASLLESGLSMMSQGKHE